MADKRSKHDRGPLQIGDVLLDRYRIVSEIETGGTSVVYEAADQRLERPVCIKVFHALRYKDGIRQTTYEHFIQEAFALSKLTHPNTLRIYDFAHLPPDSPGGPEGAPFQVSELMRGGTLSTLVRSRGALDKKEFLQVIGALGGALAEAHDIGIIHRDIKPKNILFGTTGIGRSVKLADFGIAKALSMELLSRRAGETQVVAGRKLLMYSGLWAAPEQLRAKEVGRPADVYSLALLAVYMMTGRCVFDSTDPKAAYEQRKQAGALIDKAIADANVPRLAVTLLKHACDLSAESRPDVTSFSRGLAAAFDSRKATDRHRAAPALADEDATTEREGKERNGKNSTARGHALHALDGAAEQSTPSGPPRHLIPSADATPIGDRTVYFAPIRSDSAELTCAQGKARVRVSLVPSAGGRFVVHIKGLNCFVQKQGARPSMAASVSEKGAVELLGKDRSKVATVSVLFGKPAAGHSVFTVDDQLVAVPKEQCPACVALDFGSGRECLFVYIPGAVTTEPAELPKRRRWRTQ